MIILHCHYHLPPLVCQTDKSIVTNEYMLKIATNYFILLLEAVTKYQ